MALHIGLNLGKNYIKACLIETTVAGWKFLEYRDFFFETTPTDEDYITKLKEFFSEDERISATFYCSLSGDDIYYRLIDNPFNDSVKTQKSVEVELDSALPVPLEELVVTYSPLSRVNGLNRVLGYGIRKEELKQKLNILTSAGIDAYIVDWDAVSLYTLSTRIKPAGDQIQLLVNVERERAQLCFYSNEGLELARSIKPGGADIADEIRATSRLIQQLTGKELKKIYISAGSASEDVAQKLSSLLGVSSEPLSPVKFFNELEQLPVSKEYHVVLPFATVLRGLYKKILIGNFRTGEFSYRKSFAEIKSSLLVAGTVAILLIILAVGDTIYKYKDRKSVYNQLQDELTKVCSEIIKGYAPDMDCAKEMRKLFSGNSSRLYSNVKVIDVLRELSVRIVQNLTVDISEITEEGEKVRLKGKAPTLDTVDKIKTELSKSQLFSNVEVVDSKQDIDGKSFNFIINLILQERSS
jgi:hypothetical protein